MNKDRNAAIIATVAIIIAETLKKQDGNGYSLDKDIFPNDDLLLANIINRFSTVARFEIL